MEGEVEEDVVILVLVVAVVVVVLEVEVDSGSAADQANRLTPASQPHCCLSVLASRKDLM